MADQLQTDKLRTDQSQSLGRQTQNQGNGLGGQAQGLDSIAGIQDDNTPERASPDTGLPSDVENSYANEQAELRESAVPAEGVSPDTGVAVAPDAQRIQADAVKARLGGADEVVQRPDSSDSPVPFKHEDQPQSHEERRDDPLAQEGTFEGKKVFRPSELNQAGEDKEYFPPDADHRYRVPEDAQHHVLRPDVVLKPGEGRPEIEVKDKQ